MALSLHAMNSEVHVLFMVKVKTCGYCCGYKENAAIGNGVSGCVVELWWYGGEIMM